MSEVIYLMLRINCQYVLIMKKFYKSVLYNCYWIWTFLLPNLWCCDIKKEVGYLLSYGTMKTKILECVSLKLKSESCISFPLHTSHWIFQLYQQFLFNSNFDTNLQMSLESRWCKQIFYNPYSLNKATTLQLYVWIT